MANCALITILEGEATARQIEHEFRTQAGPTSSWRWYAKKLSYFIGMRMRTNPEVTLKVEKWKSNAGAKFGIESAWFRILGIPVEKITIKKLV